MRLGVGAYLAAGIGLALAVPMMMTWERPPMDTEQVGFRGTAMEQITNPRILKAKQAATTIPEASDQAETGGQKASEIYQNVKVLGDLNEAQFTRLMLAITEWVSPEEGCNYCHNEENLADDSVYTKVVARKMLQMTANINSQWKPHVADTGVTCYTCHRGQPVPKNTWAMNPGNLPETGGWNASRMGQNLASKEVGTTSMHYDPFTDLLSKSQPIRVAAQTALPEGHVSSNQATEKTYSLMMHFSQSLAVNCTFCHNSRNFSDWTQSPPTRVKAWHGIEMVSHVNKNYMDTLADVFPDNRKGPKGDVLKANCATCHQGANKPLYGAQMLKDYIVELSAAKQ